MQIPMRDEISLNLDKIETNVLVDWFMTIIPYKITWHWQSWDYYTIIGLWLRKGVVGYFGSYIVFSMRQKAVQ